MIPIFSSLSKGLWLRLEDAEVFFYSTSRIHSDQRFQIEQRPILHILNGTSSYEIMTYSLTIDDVRLSDEGTYSCQADNRIIKLFLLNIVGKYDPQKFMTSIHILHWITSSSCLFFMTAEEKRRSRQENEASNFLFPSSFSSNEDVNRKENLADFLSGH